MPRKHWTTLAAISSKLESVRAVLVVIAADIDISLKRDHYDTLFRSAIAKFRLCVCDIADEHTATLPSSHRMNGNIVSVEMANDLSPDKCETAIGSVSTSKTSRPFVGKWRVRKPVDR